MVSNHTKRPAFISTIFSLKVYTPEVAPRITRISILDVNDAIDFSRFDTTYAILIGSPPHVYRAYVLSRLLAIH